MSCLENYENNILVFYENFNNNFFYQLFKHKNKVYVPDSNFLVGDLEKLQKFINEESKKNKDFTLVSNSNKFFSSLNWKKKKKKKFSNLALKELQMRFFLVMVKITKV